MRGHLTGIAWKIDFISYFLPVVSPINVGAWKEARLRRITIRMHFVFSKNFVSFVQNIISDPRLLFFVLQASRLASLFHAKNLPYCARWKAWAGVFASFRLGTYA